MVDNRGRLVEHGPGTWTYPGGAKFTAVFRMGNINTARPITYVMGGAARGRESAIMYEGFVTGTVQDLKTHGQGRLTYSDGTVVEGEFVRGELRVP